ncbi:hypothetical protein KZX37_08885 [Microbacterium sp. EYE_5]|uniref:hypothetical protein n=1 Tax=unclassified Microbacterium TaxID=2609290 RepID=UPI0020062C3C|nr:MULTISPECIES: hypothetical protein [unclassified Microbacterium]MCK6081371.1 hypothetical protein [Microbacterium sp. EYE_382]MCK6086641.1 hypothetical protein [Microbacterium sp. EYE_384]MCK6123861.1 hypothetical protein [Microbacterium sp. EYE_80]MCK6126770.1 hypothetical protein [Microbacterium sp. EYE_79]MCK6142326.1 hypothetical protein [Microbacterium sp. EYE_39]
MPRTPRPTLVAAAVAAGALMLASCGPGEPAPVPSTGAAVTVFLHQNRSDEPQRKAQLRVANDSDATLDIARLRLVDDRLRDEITRDARPLGEGESYDFAVLLPGVACGEADRARLWELTLTDGTVLRGDLHDSLGFLGRLHERECLAADVQRSVRVAWGELRVAGDDRAVLPLRIERVGGADAARIVAVQSTNLLQFGPGVSRFPVPQGASVVDVPLVPQRCDPHVVAEDKRGTVFTVEVELAGRAGEIEVAAGERGRGRILSWVAEVCGFGR